jgi:serine/threonine protein kinase
VITAGYSPVEQYYRGGHVGPWTDVYAVGASIRTCMEGHTPPPAIERHQQDKLAPATVELKNRYPLFLLEAVDWSMSMDPTQRPQDAGKLLAALITHVGNVPDSRFSEPSPEGRLKELPASKSEHLT